MKTVDPPRPTVALAAPRLRDLTNSTGLGGLVAGDGTWLTLGEVIARYRHAGFHDAESTIRREIDDLATSGSLASYRTRGGHRRVAAAGVDQLIAERLNPAGPKGDHVPDPATTPEPSPVVAAIVTSHLGVLAGRRHDGKPPWTFIAGEIEPGESAADAAVREVKEETGLLVTAGEREIGRRVHPKTGRTMIYLACQPSGKLDTIVGDEDELAEVRWLTLAEVDELLPGVFEPVLAHLRAELT
ncbi:NUDIX hydrolase [Verrucosispora sp. SN26_14.1]|uniref:NUDIX hydrolase n=1 Tax=Verrucosispora sp. SN26_14.1 TaxID=2527879 RepID=UPI0010340787|nr:NUDIX hydrolase [Verrucosispora sp. SN26_14.1]TBL44222.1 NUDIX hydrolase [Verrucosispora sp. SN26_14.1]